MYQIRTGAEADFPRIVAIINAQLSEPITLEDYIRQEQNRREEDIFQRLVAVDEQGEVLGLGSTFHGETMRPGHFFIKARVDRPYRGQGIGSALYARVEEHARASGAIKLETDILEADPESQAWAERRGFVKTHHIFESTINLSQFDPAHFGSEVERVRARGIRFVDLATQYPGEEQLRRYYEIVWAATKDVPVVGENPPPSFETWQKWVTGNPRFNPHSVFLAMDGDRCAGISDLSLAPSGALGNAITGVFREYRGWGIATALKVVALDWAKQQGAPYVRTNNHSANAPMLAVNRKLGYVPEPGIFIYEKTL